MQLSEKVKLAIAVLAVPASLLGAVKGWEGIKADLGARDEERALRRLNQAVLQCEVAELRRFANEGRPLENRCYELVLAERLKKATGARSAESMSATINGGARK